jgi:hypothetical protein
MTDPARDLTVGFSSLADRASAIVVPGADVASECVVVLQTGGSATDADRLAQDVARLEGDGARVVVLDSRGVARSRNEVLRQARTRYVLFSDDDVTVDRDGVAAAVGHLKVTGHALALGRAVDDTGQFRKAYPEQVTALTLYNSARAATYEMVVDVEQSTAAGVWFDERFGAGAPLYLGDEYIFIADLLRAGAKADAVPFTVAMHPVDSSGSRWGTDADVDARSAALSRALGRRAWWVKPLFAARHLRELGMRGALRFVRGPGLD